LAWDEAFNTADLERLMELYNENAVSMPPGLPALEGKAAIEADFQWLLDNFTAQHQTTIVDLEIADNLAVEQGQYTMMLTPNDGSEPINEVGKHIVVRRKTGDTWQVVREIWNTDE
jgi:ketosteroid isomerase-like protein